MHKTVASELDTHYSKSLFAIYVGGLLFTGIALLVAGHPFYGALALVLCALPFVFRDRR
jgi:hypothetical protein